MSETSIQASATCLGLRPAAAEEELRGAGVDEEARIIATIRLEFEAFAADVGRELEAVRSQLGAPRSGPWPDGPRDVVRSPRQESPLGNLSTSLPADRPQLSSVERPQTAVAEVNSQDRIAALKQRLAAKLRSEPQFGPLHALSEGTRRNGGTGGD